MSRIHYYLFLGMVVIHRKKQISADNECDGNPWLLFYLRYALRWLTQAVLDRSRRNTTLSHRVLLIEPQSGMHLSFFFFLQLRVLSGGVSFTVAPSCVSAWKQESVMCIILLRFFFYIYLTHFSPFPGVKFCILRREYITLWMIFIRLWETKQYLLTS